MQTMAGWVGRTVIQVIQGPAILNCGVRNHSPLLRRKKKMPPFPDSLQVQIEITEAEELPAVASLCLVLSVHRKIRGKTQLRKSEDHDLICSHHLCPAI